jgi:hypothetical protein
MSAIAADGASVPAEPGRFKRFLRRMRVRAAKVWASVKDASLWTGRTVKDATLATGRAAVRTLGAIGATVFWVAKSLIGIVGLALIGLAGVIIVVLGGLVSIVSYVLAKAHEVVNRYLFRPFLWLAKGRPVPYKAFHGNADKVQKEKTQKIWGSVTDRLKDAGLPEDLVERHGAEAEVVEEGPDMGAIRVRFKRSPLTDPDTIDDPAVKEALAAFTRKAAQYVQEATESPTLNLPGVKAAIPVEVPFDPESKLENPDDPFSNEGALFEPNFTVIRDYFSSGKTAVDFDFTPYLNEPEILLMSYEYLRDSSGNIIEERSYWQGRHEMLRRWIAMGTKKRRDDLLDEHGRVWALVHAELFNQQETFSLKHVYTGLKDQVAELKSIRTTATR